MKTVRVKHAKSGLPVGASVAVADTWWTRFRGLLSRPPMKKGEGMLLLTCGSVHTAGMTYPIDVAFLDAAGNVIRTIAWLEPWRVGLGGSDAVHALELPAGRLYETGTAPGVRLEWR